MTVGVRGNPEKNKARRSNTSFPRTREPREKQSTPLPRKRTGVAEGRESKRLFLWLWVPAKPRHSRGRGNPGKNKPRRYRASGPGWPKGAGGNGCFMCCWVPASAGITSSARECGNRGKMHADARGNDGGCGNHVRGVPEVNGCFMALGSRRSPRVPSFPARVPSFPGRGNREKNKARRYRGSGPGWSRGAEVNGCFMCCWVPASAGMTAAGGNDVRGPREPREK